MPRPCSLQAIDPHTEPREGCGVCQLYLTNPKVRAAMDRPESKAATVNDEARKPVRFVKVCANRGEQVDEVKCQTCRGNTTTRVYACSKHGTCTVGKKVAGHHLCDGGG